MDIKAQGKDEHLKLRVCFHSTFYVAENEFAENILNTHRNKSAKCYIEKYLLKNYLTFGLSFTEFPTSNVSCFGRT